MSKGPRMPTMPEPMGDDRFLIPLLSEGRLLIGAESDMHMTDEGIAALRSASLAARRRLAAPPLDEALDAAIAAVPIVYRFGWLYLNPQPEPLDFDRLFPPASPRSAAEHLAADLTFRFLPGLYHRIVGRNRQDPLAKPLARVLRSWPLSGVLADIAEPPLVPPTFGHLGLAYLYAERLAKRERRGWLPGGTDRDAAEVVRTVLGKPKLEIEEPLLEATDP